MKNHLIYCLWLVSILLFNSCSNEEITITEKDPNIEAFENNFNLENFNNELYILPDDTYINWENYQTKDYNGTTFYEFKAESIGFRAIIEGIEQNDQTSLIAFFNTNNEIEYFFIKLKPENDLNATNYWYLEPDNFNGTAYMYNYYGELLRLEYWENDSVVSSIVDVENIETGLPTRSARCEQKILDQVKTNSFDCCAPPDHTDDGCNGGGGGNINAGAWVPLYTYHYTDWYKVWPNGYYEFTHRQYHQTTIEYIYVSNPNNDGYVEYRYNNYVYPDGSNGEGGGSPVAVLSSGIFNMSEDEIEAALEGITSDWPFPHCSSFEYANNEFDVKIAAVKDINNTFYSAILEPSTAGIIWYNTTHRTLYFTMPSNMTNGMAATLTAQALAKAENDTETYFWNNPETDEFVLLELWFSNMQKEMSNIGGSVSRNDLNNFKGTPSEYIRMLETTGNCN